MKIGTNQVNKQYEGIYPTKELEKLAREQGLILNEDTSLVEKSRVAQAHADGSQASLSLNTQAKQSKTKNIRSQFNKLVQRGQNSKSTFKNELKQLLNKELDLNSMGMMIDKYRESPKLINELAAKLSLYISGFENYSSFRFETWDTENVEVLNVLYDVMLDAKCYLFRDFLLNEGYRYPNLIPLIELDSTMQSRNVQNSIHEDAYVEQQIVDAYNRINNPDTYVNYDMNLAYHDLNLLIENYGFEDMLLYLVKFSENIKSNLMGLHDFGLLSEECYSELIRKMDALTA